MNFLCLPKSIDTVLVLVLSNCTSQCFCLECIIIGLVHHEFLISLSIGLIFTKFHECYI